MPYCQVTTIRKYFPGLFCVKVDVISTSRKLNRCRLNFSFWLIYNKCNSAIFWCEFIWYLSASVENFIKENSMTRIKTDMDNFIKAMLILILVY